MVPNEIIYTDGRDIVVTRSTFQVKNTFYMLQGITKHGLSVIRPRKLPAVLFMFVGLAIVLASFMGFVPGFAVKNLWIDQGIIMATGALLVIIGCILMLTIKEKYAVRIDTAEGEKDVVVSTHREYIAQIITALNRAFMVLEKPSMTISNKVI
jgi:hypothetical protein